MASSSSSSSSSSSNVPPFDASMALAYNSSFPPSSMVVTREELNAFHKIDRSLFARLVFVLGRDIAQSAQVMAFLLWLEHCGEARNLVAYLISLPDAFIGAVADEAVVCLNCLCYEDFALFAVNFGFHSNYDAIPLIKRLTKSRLTLRFFHQNRETILRGFTKNLTEICNRAFEDICARAERFNKEKVLEEERKKAEEEMNRMMMISRIHRVVDQGESSVESAMQSLVLSDQQESINTLPPTSPATPTPTPTLPPPPPVVEAPSTALQTGGGSSSVGGGSDSSAATVEEQVPADDRTIFLTFSKGYPISEPEVRSFFTRRFGDVIDVIQMQEVDENEQPLYARMVLRSASTIPVMLGWRSKNKFTINGKHVWARKYVRKGPRSPTDASSSYPASF